MRGDVGIPDIFFYHKYPLTVICKGLITISAESLNKQAQIAVLANVYGPLEREQQASGTNVRLQDTVWRHQQGAVGLRRRLANIACCLHRGKVLVWQITSRKILSSVL